MNRSLFEAVLDLATHAAADILDVYESEFAVSHKGDETPLTHADLAAHRRIEAGLRALAPDIPVVSEEGAQAHAWPVRRDWHRLWLVDPLDGTREFVKRNGEFTVNIALVESGEPVFGVIQQPVSGALWWGGRGLGAFRRQHGHDHPLQVASPAQRPLRVAASRSHRNDETETLLSRMGEVLPIGCGSSLKFCMIAEGRMEVYPRFGPTSEWDTAAGQAILEAAGGQVLALDGSRLRYNQRETLLNPHFIALGDAALDWRSWL